MPWSKVFAFSDPFPYQAAIRAADVELYPTTRGEFRAELTQITLNQLWMQRFHEKLPQVFVSKIKPGRKVIGFLTGEQPAIQHCGMNLSPRDIVICNSDAMHHRRSEEHTSELQSRQYLVCRLLLEKKNNSVATFRAKCR